MTPASFANLEGFESHEVRKKRLGQYFSGRRVSTLLIALASHRVIRSVVDPMGGCGDMLLAARNVISKCSRTDGIEIDPLAHRECIAMQGSNGMIKSTYLLGSAFDTGVLSGLLLEGYDLVVTNPPYVRYQTQKEGAGFNAKLPSALEVRNGLRNCLAQLTFSDAVDKDAFLTLTESYSGLSDLAVPSWLLCAALVKPGGTLAMVVPDAWLNRDYASIVRYLLLRWFRIEYIIEDAHAVWFQDAQVKTTLLIARRIPRKLSVSDWSDETYLHVSIPSNFANESSIVGRTSFGTHKNPELAFATQARLVLDGKTDELIEGVTWQRIRLADQAASIARQAITEPWFTRVEPQTASNHGKSCLPPPILASLFSRFQTFTSLKDLGVEVGQGLRTGANDFFYVDAVATRKKSVTVRLSKLFGEELLDLPTSCVLPIVRKQADLADKVIVDVDTLPGAVLDLRAWALPEHASDARAKPLPDAAAAHLRCAAKALVGEKLLPTLSAVAPNERKANSRTGAPSRFWYMLPNFAPRHSPDIFIARVNGDTPRALLNPQRRALVDANFATLWLRSDANVTVPAILALLNSSVAVALYEHLGAVLGGGALKLEASHLRLLPVPAISNKAWKRLDVLGQKLANTTASRWHAAIRRVDILLCTEMFGAMEAENKLALFHAATKRRKTARLYKP